MLLSSLARGYNISDDIFLYNEMGYPEDNSEIRRLNSETARPRAVPSFESRVPSYAPLALGFKPAPTD